MVMDPNYIGATDADQGGFGSTWGKLKSGVVGKILHDLYTLPERAGQVAYDYGQTGQYNPAPIMEAAMTATTGGMPFAQAGALGSAGGKGIRAYHGSPHDFDKFDLSKIGTGEGAQAYGHGLYFAENEGVARQYREVLGAKGNKVLTPGGGELPGALMWGPEGNKVALQELKNAGSYDGARANLQQALENTKAWGNPGTHLIEALESLTQLEKSGYGAVKGGKMYEVNINAHPDQFLDWDKRIASPDAMETFAAKFDSVNPTIRKTLEDWAYSNNQRGMPLPDGQSIVQALGGIEGASARQLSRTMNTAGIPGIKYLDQGSRTAGQGTNNYVVFDDKLIDILKKYGIAGPLGALMAQGNETQQ
jgi:hypothetical protein